MININNENPNNSSQLFGIIGKAVGESEKGKTSMIIKNLSAETENDLIIMGFAVDNQINANLEVVSEISWKEEKDKQYEIYNFIYKTSHENIKESNKEESNFCKKVLDFISKTKKD